MQFQHGSVKLQVEIQKMSRISRVNTGGCSTALARLTRDIDSQRSSWTVRPQQVTCKKSKLNLKSRLEGVSP